MVGCIGTEAVLNTAIGVATAMPFCITEKKRQSPFMAKMQQGRLPQYSNADKT